MIGLGRESWRVVRTVLLAFEAELVAILHKVCESALVTVGPRCDNDHVRNASYVDPFTQPPGAKHRVYSLKFPRAANVNLCPLSNAEIQRRPREPMPSQGNTNTVLPPPGQT